MYIHVRIHIHNIRKQAQTQAVQTIDSKAFGAVKAEGVVADDEHRRIQPATITPYHVLP